MICIKLDIIVVIQTNNAIRCNQRKHPIVSTMYALCMESTKCTSNNLTQKSSKLVIGINYHQNETHIQKTTITTIKHIRQSFPSSSRGKTLTSNGICISQQLHNYNGVSTVSDITEYNNKNLFSIPSINCQITPSPSSLCKSYKESWLAGSH